MHTAVYAALLTTLAAGPLAARDILLGSPLDCDLRGLVLFNNIMTTIQPMQRQTIAARRLAMTLTKGQISPCARLLRCTLGWTL